MKNLKHSGETFNTTAGADLTSGQGLKVGNLFGVVKNGVSSGETAVVQRKGCFELTKLSTDDVSQGDKLYWDDTNKRLTLTESTHLLAGYAEADSGSGETTVRIILV